MQYTLTYRTSVGALTLPAHDVDEALEKAHALQAEGFQSVEIIDPEGHRHDPASFERAAHRPGAGPTLH